MADADKPMLSIDRLTYNLVFSAIVGVVEHAVVEEVFAHMRGAGVDADAFTFNTLIAAAAHAGGCATLTLPNPNPNPSTR